MDRPTAEVSCAYKRVLVVNLDAADRGLTERWMAEGKLPTLEGLRRKGCYGALTNYPRFVAETGHTNFLTGCQPPTTGYWTFLQYSPETYSCRIVQNYDFERVPPFHEVADNDFRVTLFDYPQSRCRERANVTQVFAWGAHGPEGPSCSSPPHLYDEIIKKHGKHPAMKKDSANLTKPESVLALAEKLASGAKLRATVTRDLMTNTDWHVFLTSFSEIHSGTHYFWPDSVARTQLQGLDEKNLILDCYQQTDATLGGVLQDLPEDMYVMVFAQEGMRSNNQDIPANVLLPELLYRYCFEGKKGLDFETPEFLEQVDNWPSHKYWKRHLLPCLREPSPRSVELRRHHSPHEAVRLEQEYGLQSLPFHPRTFEILSYLPTMWYSPVWPRMSAFALPSFSDGQVRINVRGRDRCGTVEQDDYSAVCDEIEAIVRELRDPLSGEPLVEDVVRTRENALSAGPQFPDADLMIVWSLAAGTTADGRYGRLGPVCPVRAGAHHLDGFFLMVGPDVPPARMPTANRVADLAPTILDFAGARVSHAMDGRSLRSQICNPQADAT